MARPAMRPKPSPATMSGSSRPSPSSTAPPPFWPPSPHWKPSLPITSCNWPCRPPCPARKCRTTWRPCLPRKACSTRCSGLCPRHPTWKPRPPRPIKAPSCRTMPSSKCISPRTGSATWASRRPSGSAANATSWAAMARSAMAAATSASPATTAWASWNRRRCGAWNFATTRPSTWWCCPPRCKTATTSLPHSKPRSAPRPIKAPFSSCMAIT
ncbi:hypothetical protein D3C71_488360 [compost metagenome]